MPSAIGLVDNLADGPSLTAAEVFGVVCSSAKVRFEAVRPYVFRVFRRASAPIRVHTGVAWTSSTPLSQAHPRDLAAFPMAWAPPWDAIEKYDDEGLPIPWLSPEEVHLNKQMDESAAAADAEALAYRCNQCGQNLFGCVCPNRV